MNRIIPDWPEWIAIFAWVTLFVLSIVLVFTIGPWWLMLTTLLLIMLRYW